MNLLDKEVAVHSAFQPLNKGAIDLPGTTVQNSSPYSFFFCVRFKVYIGINLCFNTLQCPIVRRIMW
jgi:hypothetical protein